MAGKGQDPNEGLADDAALATDLGDEATRQAEQLSYYGGDLDDIDDEDLSAVDRGDVIGEDDDADESEEESESDEEVAESAEAEDSDVSEADGEGEDEAEDDGADAGDQDGTESDDDESGDDEPAAEAEEVEEEEPKDRGIPRHRFNEVNQRMKDAEARLAAIEAKETAVEEATEAKYDFEEAEAEYVDLLLDGKTKEAAAKRTEIRAAEKAEFMAEAKESTVESVEQTNLERTIHSLSQEAEQMFPVFDQNSEEFNPEAVNKTLVFMRGYQAEGMRGDDAFVAALADTIQMFGLAAPDEVTEEQSDEEAPPKVTKKAPIKKTAEKIKASKKQAKSPVGHGEKSADQGLVVPNVMDMSDEEMDALPESTLAKLRGDFI